MAQQKSKQELELERFNRALDPDAPKEAAPFVSDLGALQAAAAKARRPLPTSDKFNKLREQLMLQGLPGKKRR